MSEEEDATTMTMKAISAEMSGLNQPPEAPIARRLRRGKTQSSRSRKRGGRTYQDEGIPLL